MNIKRCVGLIYENAVKCIFLFLLILSFGLQSENYLLCFMWFGIVLPFLLLLLLKANLTRERFYNRTTILYAVISFIFSFLYTVFSSNQGEQTVINFGALLMYSISYMLVPLQVLKILKYIKLVRKLHDESSQ